MRAVAPDRDPRLDLVIAGMDVTGKTLQPVGDELHRPAQHYRSAAVAISSG